MFSHCDSLVLLSKGHVIYCGPSNEAHGYFMETLSPVRDSQLDYFNVANFVADISACFVKDGDVS